MVERSIYLTDGAILAALPVLASQISTLAPALSLQLDWGRLFSTVNTSKVTTSDAQYLLSSHRHVADRIAPVRI